MNVIWCIYLCNSLVYTPHCRFKKVKLIFQRTVLNVLYNPFHTGSLLSILCVAIKSIKQLILICRFSCHLNAFRFVFFLLL